MIDRLRIDFGTALRSLRATPAPVAAAILTLAIAAGVNLAMVGLIDRALLSPPAGIGDPDRLVTLAFQPPGDSAAARMVTTSYVTFTDLRDHVPSLAGVAAFQRVPSTVMLDGDQRRVSTMIVSGEYFDVLGASPLVGRVIAPGDNEAGAALPVALVSHAFWRSALQGDAGVIGRRLRVRDLEYTVIGVMPAGFTGHTSAAVDFWVPFAAAMRDSPGWDQDRFRNMVTIVARVAAGETIAAVETQAFAVAGRRVSARGLIGAEIAVTEQRVAWWLAGVSLLVFVAGLANTATLMSVRAAQRRYDVAVRAALGASRRRLLVQGVMESLVVAGAATMISLVAASWLDEAVRSVLFPGLSARPGLTTTAAATAALAGLLAFLVTAATNIRQLPSNVQAIDLSGVAPGGTRRTRTMTALLLVQTTMSVLLLAGAGLFGASLYRLGSQDFGMQMNDVLIVDFEPGPERIDDQDGIFRRALEQVRHMPGVAMATTIDAIPFSGFHVPPIAVPGRAEPPAVGRQLPFLTAATPEFFKILGIRLVEGRLLTDADDRGAPVVVVNQAMARGIWPGEHAIGKCIRIGFDPDFDPETAAGPPTPSDRVPCRQVVGIVRDVRQRSVLPADNEDRLMQYFVPPSQAPFPPFAVNPNRVRGLMIRASASARALAPPVRRAVIGDRMDLPFTRVRPYSELLERQVRPWTIGATLLTLFSALALTVAAIGLYAAFAHAIAERRREMAIRMAVGAAPSRVVSLVMREAVALAAAGGVLGCAAAVAAGRWVQSLLYGTQVWDPLVLGAAAGVMIIVAALASARPARSAARSDPAALLKAQ